MTVSGTVSVASHGGAGAGTTATLTITDDDLPAVTIAAETGSVTEGDQRGVRADPGRGDHGDAGGDGASDPVGSLPQGPCRLHGGGAGGVQCRVRDHDPDGGDPGRRNRRGERLHHRDGDGRLGCGLPVGDGVVGQGHGGRRRPADGDAGAESADDRGAGRHGDQRKGRVGVGGDGDGAAGGGHGVHGDGIRDPGGRLHTEPEQGVELRGPGHREHRGGDRHGGEQRRGRGGQDR